MGDLGSIPGLGTSPGEEKGYPLQYSGLENSMDCIVHRVAKSRTRLSDFHFHVTDSLESPFRSGSVLDGLGTRDTWGLGEGQDAGLGGAPVWWVQVIDVSGEDSHA